MASAFGIGSTAFTVWMLASLRWVMVTSPWLFLSMDTRNGRQDRALPD